MDSSIEEGASRQHDRWRPKDHTGLGSNARHAIARHQNVVNRLGEEHQIGLVLQAGSDRLAIEHPISLGPCGPNRGALGGVENSKLNARLIGGNGHGPTQGIDLFHQVTLANAADRRIAGHLAERLQGVGHKQRCSAGAGRGQGGLRAGMAATHDNHIKLLRIIHFALGWACCHASCQKEADYRRPSPLWTGLRLRNQRMRFVSRETWFHVKQHSQRRPATVTYFVSRYSSKP